MIEKINVPLNWFSDIVYDHNDSNKMVVGLFKLGPFSNKFLRIVEKQLVLTEGRYLLYFR